MDKIIKDFMYYLEFEENKKLNTIISVQTDIEQFFEYFKNKNIKNIIEIDFFMLKEYLKVLKSSDISISSMNRKISSIKKLYKYLKLKKVITNNITLPLKSFEIEEKEVDWLSYQEIEMLRTSLTKNINFNSLRDNLIFELLYSSGLTTSELLSLGEANFSLEDREIRFFKADKVKVLFFSKRCKKAFEDFIKIKKEKFKEENNVNIVFVNNSNKRLSDRSLRRIISRYSENANIKKNVSPYTIRHTFCVTLLKKGMPKEYLKEMLDISNKDFFTSYENILKKENL